MSTKKIKSIKIHCIESINPLNKPIYIPLHCPKCSIKLISYLYLFNENGIVPFFDTSNKFYCSTCKKVFLDLPDEEVEDFCKLLIN